MPSIPPPLPPVPENVRQTTLFADAVPGVTLADSQQPSSQARELLETVASQVQPILRRRKWTVPMLSEFYPQQRNLLVVLRPYAAVRSLLAC